MKLDRKQDNISYYYSTNTEKKNDYHQVAAKNNILELQILLS